MAIKGLNQLRELFKEPQLTHKWNITVQWPSAIKPANTDIIFMVTSSDLPNPKWDNVKVELGGFSMNYNGKEERNSEITWTFFENTDGDIIKYFFIDYSNLRQNHSSESSITLESKDSSALIAKVVTMSLYANDNVTEKKRIKLLNCLFEPSTYGASLTQEAGIQKPTVKVIFDSFVIENL